MNTLLLQKIRPVSPLLFWCSPSTVLFTVISVIVNAVNRFTLRFFSHISKKVLKGRPSLANSDTSTPVSGVSCVHRISASSNHSSPSVIGGTDESIARVSVPIVWIRRFLFPTTAGFRNASPNNNAFKSFLVSTDTSTKPLGLPCGSIFRPTNYSPTIKSFVRKVDGIHKHYYSGFSAVYQGFLTLA